MIELISALIGVVIGGIITYYFSTKLLRKQLELQQAYEFVSKNYLPLLSSITEYKFSLVLWTKATKGDIDKDSRNPLTEIEASNLYADACIRLKQSLERFVTSGVLLIIAEIDENLASYILGIYYRMRRWKFRPEDISTPSDVDLNYKVVIELEKMLSALSIPTVVKEYQNIMKKGLKSKG